MSFEPGPAVNRQANRHWREDEQSSRQAGRGRMMRQEGHLQYVGDCASILTQARKSSLPSRAYLPSSDLRNSLFSSLWREGLLSQQPSIVWDEFVGPGDFTHLSVVTEVFCLVSPCLSVGYMSWLLPSHHQLLSAAAQGLGPGEDLWVQISTSQT